MIKYNSEIGEKVISDLKGASEIINYEIANKIASDFNNLTNVGLFSSQLNNIISAVRGLAESFDGFASAISGANDSWAEVVEESSNATEEFVEKVEAKRKGSNGTQRNGGTSGNNNFQGPSKVTDVNKGKSILSDSGRIVTTDEIKELIAKLDEKTLPILLQKINGLSNGEKIEDLLFDKEKSNIITVILKKILGDTYVKTQSVSLETEDIQKIILEKINKDGIDLTTEEGRNKLNQYLQEALKMNLDETVWYKTLYGDNVVKKDLTHIVEGNWIVANTANELIEYNKYVLTSGVKQDANTAEWGDKCLSFAEAHAYDLYHGTKTKPLPAASYTRGGFKDFMSDDKQTVLAEIYNQITSGKPVVLQVNGNKEGTSRHFVTVVGFKDGVISGATLKETDLLIIDSWDGKIERMDTAKSRFMTSGAQCRNKGYTGYRLRVFKDGE